MRFEIYSKWLWWECFLLHFQAFSKENRLKICCIENTKKTLLHLSETPKITFSRLVVVVQPYTLLLVFWNFSGKLELGKKPTFHSRGIETCFQPLKLKDWISLFFLSKPLFSEFVRKSWVRFPNLHTEDVTIKTNAFSKCENSKRGEGQLNVRNENHIGEYHSFI